MWYLRNKTYCKVNNAIQETATSLPAHLQVVNEKTFPQKLTLAFVDKLFNPDKELPLTIRTYDTVSGQCGSGGMTFIHILLRKESVEVR
jgi:hypothetical protein